MRTRNPPASLTRIAVAGRLAALLAVLVPLSSLQAQLRTHKDSDTTDAATPAPKKKKVVKPAADDADEAPAKGSAGVKKPFNKATPAPKTDKTDKTDKGDKADKPEPEPEASKPSVSGAAPNASIAPEELVEFKAQPDAVKKVIQMGLDLARQNLTYTFGSCDPANGGLDCSGFIYHVLKQEGFSQAPRDSSGQYSWVRRARTFRAVLSRKPDSFEFEELLPGDLLFWTGTYATDHDPPVSHVMIYLGTEKSTGTKVMLGSSDGRTYHGQKRNGVSVFDFVLPRAAITGDQRSTFVGYARIPGLRD